MSKRLKGRAKKLVDPLRFYFSDANLRRDRFMRSIIENDPERYFPVKTFLKFNKVKNITGKVHDIVNAIEAIDELELSDDRQLVRRKQPHVEEKDVDACSVYVENIPETADHDDLHRLFSRFGSVEYVSLPRWPNKIHKGFAFIEFASPLEANDCRMHYEKQPRPSLPMAATCWKGPPVHANAFETAHSTGDTDTAVTIAARALQEHTTDRSGTHIDKSVISEERIFASETNLNEAASSDSSLQEQNKPSTSDTVPGDPGEGIRVLLKSEWLNMKREYKALQRKLITSLKHMHHDSSGSTRRHSGENFPSNTDLANNSQNKPNSKEKFEAPLHDNDVFDPSHIIRGVVVKLTNIPSGVTKKQIREHLLQRSNEDTSSIEYLDFSLGATEGYVRMKEPLSARVLLQSSPHPDDEDLWGKLKLEKLRGAPEVEYWKRIHDSKIERKQKRSKKGKSRWLVAEATEPHMAVKTRDKPLASEIERTHITFDDSDNEQNPSETNESPTPMANSSTLADGPTAEEIAAAISGDGTTMEAPVLADSVTGAVQTTHSRIRRRSITRSASGRDQKYGDSFDNCKQSQKKNKKTKKLKQPSTSTQAKANEMNKVKRKHESDNQRSSPTASIDSQHAISDNNKGQNEGKRPTKLAKLDTASS